MNYKNELQTKPTFYNFVYENSEKYINVSGYGGFAVVLFPKLYAQITNTIDFLILKADGNLIGTSDWTANPTSFRFIIMY